MNDQPPTQYSIREVSELTDVPAHTLRFWERTLAPVLEPYRTPGGQRRYDDEHLAIIREVRRRVNEEHQSLAAIRHGFLRARRATGAGRALSERLLADPTVQQALDDVAEALKIRVLHLLDAQAAEAADPSTQGAAS